MQQPRLPQSLPNKLFSISPKSSLKFRLLFFSTEFPDAGTLRLIFTTTLLF